MIKVALADDHEIVRYGFVGILGLVVDFGSFWLFTSNGISILISQWIAAFLGFAHNHTWHHFWVFDHNQPLQKTSVQSLALSIISIIISGPLTFGFNTVLQNIWISKILALTILSVLLFIIRKIWIFQQTKKII